MRNQPAFLNADTPIRLHSDVTATLQLCAVSLFARGVDTTVLSFTTLLTTPPPSHPLTPVTLGRNATGGGKTGVPTAGHSTPALIPTPMNTRATFPRATRFTREPIAPWTPLAPALARPQRRAPQGAFRVAPHLFIQGTPEPTSVVPGKILSPFRLFRGRLAVGTRPRLTWFLRERAAFSTGVRRLSRFPKNDAAQPRLSATLRDTRRDGYGGSQCIYF